MTSRPATPLDNKAAIAQMGQELRDSMSFLLTEFVRPTMLQTQANAEALTRTEAICESNARSIAAEGNHTRELRESVEILRNVADDTAGETSNHEPRISDNEQRFQTLLAEAREDRQRSDERFAAQGQRLDRALNELAAQRESMRALLSALATMSGRVDNLEQAS